ncbi:uncharacterized protein LOC129769861 [Toxorhynchites rutilus septentrionalis]|uniref:uncharacterized protein LOC129769861 n=1 Tax=Toxorhynchites rutilus septentrionalis TaxID=329112 RepID=UPI0024794C22|nr:uncharacterized protein LOC129769861 [Toxorhynchites rutilus septentrionalis]
MVLLSEIYCPEQIVIPENFNNVLKLYAKAVIRTQPFDLLRWSAAYFRCLATDRVPPIKPRYEPEARAGRLTAGALRVLIDQLGKGYFVQKRTLLEKWQGLCLPEDDLLNILSLLRMLDWPHLHWLKIVAVFIGLLSDSLVRTADMICELLSEEPEGGPSPIPLWMFKECFLTVARLDCDSVQTFVDGRKVLDGGLLERKQPMTEMPKVLSTISFKNAIIDKYKSVMGVDTKSTAADAELLSTDDRFSEISTVPSRLDSDFKFVGDETDPLEVLRRAPDFDSVIVLLGNLREDKLRQQLSSVSIPEAKLVHAKERAQRIEDLRESLPEYDYEKLMDAEKQQLLKDMGPPWLLLYLFSRTAGPGRSYNYVDETSMENELLDDYSNYSFDMAGADKLERSPEPEEEVEATPDADHEPERRRSSYSLPASVRSRMSSVHSSATRIANEVLSRVICMVDEAIIDGECELSVPSIASFVEQKSQVDASISEHDYNTLRDFLEEADKKDLEVKDLNQLYHFFVGESFKSSGYEAQRKRSQEITSIFEASGIEVDNKLLDAQISENMILGLVPEEQTQEKKRTLEPTSEPEPNAAPLVEGSIHSEAKQDHESLQAVIEVEEEHNESEEPNEPEEDEPAPEPEAAPPEVATQTEPLSVKCTELMRRKTLTRSTDLAVEYSCKIPRLPGIGPPLAEEIIETFLAYLAKRAVHQQGLIYPRNFREPPCPKIAEV